MSLTRMLEYTKPEKTESNNILLEIARKVINSSPEPRYKIKLRDDILAMKEKERLGFNFNRSVAASLRSRWDVVEKATIDFLREIIDMNDQIEEDSIKYENQLINLIVTRTTNLGLNSRIEQMAGLFMHMNFYCTVLRFKIQQLEPTRMFIFTCSDMMGFSRPSQLIDRYAALQHVFTELYADYDTRQNLLNHLTETLSEVKSETNHRNMLMHNHMAEMHSRIKNLQTESAQLERAILDQMELSTGASLEIYKIKNAVYNIYVTMMSYRNMEPTQTESFGQLDELEVRITHTQAAVKKLQSDEAKRQSKKKQKKKNETLEAVQSLDDVYTDSNKSDEESDNPSKMNTTSNYNLNSSGAEFTPMRGAGSGIHRPKSIKASEKMKLVKLVQHEAVESEQTKLLRQRLPPISNKDLCMSHTGSGEQAGDTQTPSQVESSSNKKPVRRVDGTAKPGRLCLSMNDSRQTLPEIRMLKRTATVLSEQTTKKCVNGSQHTTRKPQEFARNGADKKVI